MHPPQSELEAWRRVGHHSYIVDLHFAFQDKHHCYFLMDLMAGADLRYYLKKKIILTEPVRTPVPILYGVSICTIGLTLTIALYLLYATGIGVLGWVHILGAAPYPLQGRVAPRRQSTLLPTLHVHPSILIYVCAA